MKRPSNDILNKSIRNDTKRVCVDDFQSLLAEFPIRDDSFPKISYDTSNDLALKSIVADPSSHSMRDLMSIDRRPPIFSGYSDSNSTNIGYNDMAYLSSTNSNSKMGEIRNNENTFVSFDYTGNRSTNLWERKCVILEEELSFHKQQFQAVRRRFENERHNRCREESEVKVKIDTIHSLQTVIDEEKDQQMEILQQRLKEETKMRKEYEEEIKRQQLKIENLKADQKEQQLKTENESSSDRGIIANSSDQEESSSPKERGTIVKQEEGGKTNDNSGSSKESTDMTILRKEIIQSRKKQLALFRKLDQYKNKAADLEDQLAEKNQQEQ